MIEESLRWIGMIAAVIAATIVAARLGGRATGLGFVVFLVSSTSWVAVGLMAGEHALMSQNAFLCIVNMLGIYRWLLRPAIGKAAPGT
jgi:nicotinamide riboside transporter PnuC